MSSHNTQHAYQRSPSADSSDEEDDWVNPTDDVTDEVPGALTKPEIGMCFTLFYTYDTNT